MKYNTCPLLGKKKVVLFLTTFFVIYRITGFHASVTAAFEHLFEHLRPQKPNSHPQAHNMIIYLFYIIKRSDPENKNPEGRATHLHHPWWVVRNRSEGEGREGAELETSASW